MFLSASRWVRWPGRRPLGALLVLIYLWAFVTLGLTHRHTLPHLAPSATASRIAVTAGVGVQLVAPPAAPAPDAPCQVCAIVHATAVALGAKPVVTRAPVPDRPRPVLAASLPPTRSIPASNPRAPPQA